MILLAHCMYLRGGLQFTLKTRHLYDKTINMFFDVLSVFYMNIICAIWKRLKTIVLGREENVHWLIRALKDTANTASLLNFWKHTFFWRLLGHQSIIICYGSFCFFFKPQNLAQRKIVWDWWFSFFRNRSGKIKKSCWCSDGGKWRKGLF